MAQELRNDPRGPATVAPLSAQSGVLSLAGDSPAPRLSANVWLRGTPAAGPLAVGSRGVWGRCAARWQAEKTVAKNKGVGETGRSPTTSQTTGNAMNAFIDKHAAKITGTLSNGIKISEKRVHMY